MEGEERREEGGVWRVKRGGRREKGRERRVERRVEEEDTFYIRMYVGTYVHTYDTQISYTLQQNATQMLYPFTCKFIQYTAQMC